MSLRLHPCPGTRTSARLTRSLFPSQSPHFRPRALFGCSRWTLENRNLFSHETAPWIALNIESREPLEFQLVVMKENLHEFDDPTTFITQDALVDMWDGYEASLMALKSWLEGLLEN